MSATLNPFDAVANYTPPVGVSKRHCRGMVVGKDGQTVGSRGPWTHTCFACGMRCDSAQGHPRGALTFRPMCQVPPSEWAAEMPR